MNDPYVRVYYRIIDDERFVGIYTNDRHLATWLRLLLMADAVWPASSPIPRSANKASLDALSAVGLIELMPNDHYRIHGLAHEREVRAHNARNAAVVRWQSDRSATAPAANMPRQDEHRQDEPTRAPAREDVDNQEETRRRTFDHRVAQTQKMLREVRGES